MRRFCTIVGDFLLFRGHLIAVVMTVAEVAEKLGKSLEETRKLIGGGDVDSSLLLAADGNGGAANGDELLLTDLDEDNPDEEEGPSLFSAALPKAQLGWPTWAIVLKPRGLSILAKVGLGMLNFG